MRVWVKRLQTALAALAAVYLLWQTPAAFGPMLAGREDAAAKPAEVQVLRVWLSESWTGTGMQWLTAQATAFEKANRNTRVVVRRAQAGDWLEAGVVPPDVLLFDVGAVRDPGAIFAPILEDYPVRDALKASGEWRGQAYAVPVCYGGYVLLTNKQKPDGIKLVMETDREYQEFAGQRAASLVATVREARKLSALEAAGKGFAFTAEPYGTQTDKLLLAGLFPGQDERARKAEAFVAFLLDDAVQNALPALGLLPASKTSDPPDEKKQPLLFALEKQVAQATNAFDEPRLHAVQ